MSGARPAKRARLDAAGASAAKSNGAATPAEDEEEAERKRFQAIAERAELRAAERARKKQHEMMRARMVAARAEATSSSSSSSSSSSFGNGKGPSSSSSSSSNPRFLSRKERERLALERLAQKRANREREREASRKERESFRGRGNDRDRRRDRDRDYKDRNRSRTYDDEGRREEFEEIKRDKLGLNDKNKKKKVKKQAELGSKFRRKFNFDWDNGEDTSTDHNPLYSRRHQATILFGRGRQGGIDLGEQRKRAIAAEDAARRKRGIADVAPSSSASGGREGAGKGRHNARGPRDRFVEGGDGVGGGGNWRDKPLEKMTKRDWRILREDFDIRVVSVGLGSGGGGKSSRREEEEKIKEVPKPLRSWSECVGLSEDVMKAIRDLGWKEPSPIQRQAVPLGMQFRDMIGIAETGSGKTGAFLIPMLEFILRRPEKERKACAEDGPLALIMAPTRDLAIQIDEAAVELSKHCGVRSYCVVGGRDIGEQGVALRKGCEIVVATPMRLLDLIDQRYILLNQANYIVLDEADRMIDMGFGPQVEAVLDSIGARTVSTNAAGEEEVSYLALVSLIPIDSIQFDWIGFVSFRFFSFRFVSFRCGVCSFLKRSRHQLNPNQLDVRNE